MVFFFKKKTAYELRINDWSSDVCSSDLNGFIEVYNDAMGIKGSYEAVLSLKDLESTKRIKAIADEAQWFEDNAPLMPEHKKKEVKGIRDGKSDVEGRRG